MGFLGAAIKQMSMVSLGPKASCSPSESIATRGARSKTSASKTSKDPCWSRFTELGSSRDSGTRSSIESQVPACGTSSHAVSRSIPGTCASFSSDLPRHSSSSVRDR